MKEIAETRSTPPNGEGYAKGSWWRPVVVLVLFGATLLPMGLSPQEAQSQQNAQDEQSAQEEPLFDEDPKGNPVAAGELLVSYERGASEQAVEEAAEAVGGQVEEDFPEIEVQLLSFPGVKNEQDQEARQRALERKKGDLERNPNVEAVDYDQFFEPGWVPNDPRFVEQWGYEKIRAPEAWDVTRVSSPYFFYEEPGIRPKRSNWVQVAVIDTGIDSERPDLNGKVADQYDFANDDPVAEESFDEDFGGHGTHVSGTIAASTDNGIGVAGVCLDCKILAAKYWDESSGGTASNAVASILWSARKGADVINMSFGARTPSTAMERAVNDAWGWGIVLVASAGNNGTDGPEQYPGAFENVIAVANADENDQRSPTSNAGDWVDVAAPGEDILSTFTSGSYRSWGGTSMATPHVSGLAGLLFSQQRTRSNSEVRKRIESTAVDLGAKGRDPVFGEGRIDARAAIE